MSATANRFGHLLKTRIGLDAGSIGEAAIERAVRLRCAASGAVNDNDYWRHLQTHPAEVQALIEAVVVPETWFYRYPESLAALVDVVRDPFKDRETIRILSLPCSTGEEPYSIVMALLDAGIAAERIVVDAVDISERVIDFARHAVYGGNSFRGEAQSLLRERHFTPTERGQALSQRVVGRVRFKQGNLFDTLLLAGAEPYDVVFCRNLLIYFDAPTQERAVKVLARLARPDGLMFVGPAEASLLTRQGMPSIGRPNAFAFSLARAKPTPPAPMQATPHAAHSWAPRTARAPVAVAAPIPVPARMPTAMPAAAQANEATADAAAESRRLADLGRVDEALAACERWLATSGPSAEAYYFQGLLHDAAGRVQQAQAGYRKALYLDPAHAPALLHLAALLESQGDIEGAQRLKARARRKERQHG
ncbi:MAG: protein-glutamate O-methyltransferase CheR [Pseudomonadota bacterium]